MKRFGSVIGVRPEKLEEYKRLHAAVWPDVLKMIGECHIRNYSIYLRRRVVGRHGRSVPPGLTLRARP